MTKTWVKIKNGRIIEYFNGRYVENSETNIRHSNPTDIHMIECGYRELISASEPLEDREGYYIETTYEDSGTQAVPVQSYVENPIVKETEEFGQIGDEQDAENSEDI